MVLLRFSLRLLHCPSSRNKPTLQSFAAMVKNPSAIGNKAKRAVVYAKYKMEKKKTKKILRAERVKETEALGDKAPPKQVPNTLESMREIDETSVKADDQEVVGDERDDEFAAYYSNEKKPKIMITTRPKPSRKLFPFIGDLMQMIPQSFYYPRERFVVEINISWNSWATCQISVQTHVLLAFTTVIKLATWP